VHIAHCLPRFIPLEGGTERAVLDLSKELVDLGHQVSVLTYNCEDRTPVSPISRAGLPPHEFIDGIEVFRFSHTFLGPGCHFSLPLSRHLLKLRPDIIHLQGFFHVIGVFLNGLCGKMMKTPVILTTHGLHETWSVLSGSPSMVRIPASLLVRLAIRNVDEIVNLSSGGKDILLRLGAEPAAIHYLPNGVDLSRFGTRTRKDVGIGSICEKYGSSNENTVLCVCRIARNKGLDNLIVAAAHVLSEFRDAIFLIVGGTEDEGYKTELLELIRRMAIQKNVVFTGHLSDEDLLGLYKSSKIFLLPSTMETLPLVIFEAMAAGCCVVATAVGGVADVIKDGGNGMLVRPGNPDEIANCVITLMRNPKLRGSLSREARRTVEGFSWHEVARKTLEIYDEALRAKDREC